MSRKNNPTWARFYSKTDLANVINERDEKILGMEEKILRLEDEIAKLNHRYQRLERTIEPYRLLVLNLITEDWIDLGSSQAIPYTPDIAQNLAKVAGADPALVPYAGIVKSKTPAATPWQERINEDPGLAPYAGMIKPAAPSASTWPEPWQERINEDAARRAAEILEDDNDEYE